MKKLDRYEKQVLSAFESGKLKSAVTSEASMRRYREAARATLGKNAREKSNAASTSRRTSRKRTAA